MNESARKFLEALFAPVAGAELFLELTGIRGGAPGVKKNVPRSLAIALDDVDWLDQAVANAQVIADEGENVYFGPAPRVRGVGPGHPRNVDADVDRMVAVWVDADPPKGADGLPLDPSWKAKHREAFAHPPLAPSARIDSGHGYHYYWFFEWPPLVSNVGACEELMRRMVAHVPDADSKVTNASRIMRLPGWPNVKDPERPVATSLDWCDPNLRYSPQEIERAFPEKKRPPERVQTSAKKERVGRLLDKEVEVLVGLWSPGHRHALALAVLGAMRKAGWSESSARSELSRICAAAADDEDRSPNVRTTWAKPIGDVAGWSDLEELGLQPALLPTLDRPMAGDGDDLPWNGREPIEIGPDDHRVVEESIQALENEPSIYRRGNSLVRILRDERECLDEATRLIFPPAAPRISVLPLPSLQELLSKNCAYLKKVPPRTPGGEWKIVQIRPPDAIVREVAARSSWPTLRPLNDVVEVPVLRPDGSVLSEAGYDEMTGLLFDPRGEVRRVEDAPTLAQARAAAELLIDVVSDFPFTHDVHRGAWLAMALTPLARYAFSGSTPAMIVSSNKRGSGKGLLADMAAVISIGRELPRSPNPEQPDELRKRITAVAIEGVRVVLIDNVDGVFGSSAFDAVVTSTSWHDRILGESANTPALPLNTMWVITGNNVALKGDLPRRSLLIRLDSPHERPEQRDDFKVVDLLAHAKSRQPELTHAALTILKAFYVAGRPQAKLPPWGSFSGWSNLVRQAIAWVMGIDVGEARAEGDTTVEVGDVVAQRLVLEAWDEVDPEGKGLTSSELLSKLRSPTAEISFERMRAAILEFAPSQRGDLPTPRQLGNKFRAIRRAVFDGRYLDMSISRGESKWRVCLTPDAAKARQQAQVRA